MREREESRPVTDERYIRPVRAAELMKTSRNTRQVLYIYGASGHGKTSLVADFLARRRYRYYSAGDSCALDAVKEDLDVLNMGMNVSEQWGKQPTVVIDDLYLLETTDIREQWYTILEKLMERKDLWLILISRSPVPRWLKSLYIKYLFFIIDEEILRLTDKERPVYFEKWDLHIAKEYADRIWEFSRGYPMFLRILAIQIKKMEGELAGGNNHRVEDAVIKRAEKDFWDYLETHVYDQWNIELQEFLMDISIVESFDLQMAQMVTKKTDAGQLISMAGETGNFMKENLTGDRVIYQLRQTLRLSLLRRLFRKCSQSHISEIYYNAGSAYELRGDVPAALGMYEHCHNEEGISRLLIQNARKNPGVGYYFELREYYLNLSEETIKESPELMCAMSMLQSVLMNVEESERWYQELEQYMKRQTGNRKSQARVRLIYLDIGLPHRGTGQMTKILKRAGVLLREGRIRLPEFSVTNNQPSIMNGGKDFCEWSKHDKELARSLGKLVEFLLGRDGKGLVSLSLAESFFEKGEDSYEVSNLLNKGRMQAESGGKQEQIFVAIGLLSQLSMLNGHIEDALELLESFRKKAKKEASQLLPNMYALRTRFLLYAGKNSEVTEWMLQAPNEDDGFCTLERFKYMTKVRAYLAVGKKEKALSLLQRMIVYAEKMKRTYIYIESCILLAITQYRMGNGKWEETLQGAVAKAEEYHFVRILTREGTALRELLRAGDIKWGDSDYRDQVFSECERIAELYPAYLDERREGDVLLSDKALKILRLQAQGLTTGQIAERLSLSAAGVKYYNKETYRKLNVSGKAAAVSEAKNRGWI